MLDHNLSSFYEKTLRCFEPEKYNIRSRSRKKVFNRQNRRQIASYLTQQKFFPRAKVNVQISRQRTWDSTKENRSGDDSGRFKALLR